MYTLEVPGAGAARGVGEANPEGQAAAGGRQIASHAGDRPRQVVCRRVIGAAIRVDGDIGVGLVHRHLLRVFEKSQYYRSEPRLHPFENGTTIHQSKAG